MSTLQSATFDRDALARWYAKQHLKTDPGIEAIYYLPTNSPDREIRFIEVNRLIGELRDDAIDVFDFGIDFGTETEHRLFVLDVTPAQWNRIREKSLAIPAGWSLDQSIPFMMPDQIDTGFEDTEDE